MKLLLIALLIIFTETQAHADWLSVCHNQPASVIQKKNNDRIAYYFSPDESVTLLQITKKPLEIQCKQIEVGISGGDILWAGFAPNVTPNMTNIALQGSTKDERFLVSEVILPDVANVATEENSIQKKTSGQVNHSKPLSRSAWFWSPDLWIDTPEKIFDVTSKFGINRIYISILTLHGEVSHATELHKFIQSAHFHGVQVWAVLGDPRAIMNEGVSAFLSATAAYTAFNNEAIPTGRLKGLQLDIEPYLIPGYLQNPEAWLSRYADVINNIHRTAPALQIDIVVPFWFDPDTPQVASMLGNVTDSINRITVMDYRTDPAQIMHFATPFLNWGMHNRKAIDIALETLPMVQEDRRHYRQADAGELLQLQVGGQSVLILLKDVYKHNESIMSYRYTYTRIIDGTDISFFKTKGAFKELMTPLEAELNLWPSFSGLAIHGLDQW
ncbi:hypothetical protein GALL_276720 [mine drainage metagenome]|uniref:Uncharacterized protein n=1 Tax=mine drainage metagenome TaxID=410659 RepID=A0A1J5R3A5_9ZZZZ